MYDWARICFGLFLIGAPLSSSYGIAAVDSDFLFLYVAPTSLPYAGGGVGVFAKVAIPKGEILCEHRGAVLPASVAYQSDYSFTITTAVHQSVNIIPQHGKMGICAFFNDCVKVIGSNYTTEQLDDMQRTYKALESYPGFEWNAAPLSTGMGKVFVMATKPIPAGSEIFYSYGNAYWIPRLRDPKGYNLPMEAPS
jgi:hypothetical protein